MLTHYRGWEMPPPESQTHKWIARIVAHPVFASTTSTEDLYLESYERYVPATRWRVS